MTWGPALIPALNDIGVCKMSKMSDLFLEIQSLLEDGLDVCEVMAALNVPEYLVLQVIESTEHCG